MHEDGPRTHEVCRTIHLRAMGSSGISRSQALVLKSPFDLGCDRPGISRSGHVELGGSQESGIRFARLSALFVIVHPAFRPSTEESVVEHLAKGC